MSGSDAGGRTILLVEDSEPIRAAFAILLEDAGYRVVPAGTGGEALALAAERAPALVLLDLGLPDMNGLEVARRLRDDPVTAAVPVVALTGRDQESDRRACVAAGCADFLIKPVDTRALVQAIPGYLT